MIPINRNNRTVALKCITTLGLTLSVACGLKGGALDLNFTPSANGTVYASAVQSDGKIVIGGSFTIVNGVARTNLARLNSDGTLDTALSLSIDGPVYSIAV